MRNFSFALICVFFVALTIGALVYAFHIQAELEAIRRENRALIESMQPSGGAETTVQDAPTGTGYQFPIHPDDYLMLTSACREKGVSLSTVRRNSLLQPLLGYSEHLRGRKRYWPKHVVEEWKGVFDKQLPVYARRLMGTENLALVAHVKEVAGKAGIV